MVRGISFAIGHTPDGWRMVITVDGQHSEPLTGDEAMEWADAAIAQITKQTKGKTTVASLGIFEALREAGADIKTKDILKVKPCVQSP